MTVSEPVDRNNKVRVVLFSGGRGSRVLSTELIRNPRVKLTLAVNGYDDGASTGEIRRFLGDSLGPSDFRKNASRLARELQSCPTSLIDLLDFRFSKDCSFDDGVQALSLICSQSSVASLTDRQSKILEYVQRIDPSFLLPITEKLSIFKTELQKKERPFSFSDCSLGNLVFSGCFLEEERKFNRSIASYCSLLHLKEDLILNVTDGMNAFLVALDRENRVLGSEAEIVDATRRNFIKDLYLIDRPLENGDQISLQTQEQISEFMETHHAKIVANEELLHRIAVADLIIYSPGTQHSSLFPSYITPGLGTAIGRNLMAVKLLVTNVQEDVEIPDSSAVDLIEKAVRYLKEKNRVQIPTPCLITHYLINDPRETGSEAPYIPLGRLETLEDPRLIRIGDYEDGITGFHDATKVLTPFVASILTQWESRKIAVLLTETNSLNKISQTVLEMLRGRIQELPVSIQVFYQSPEPLDIAFQESLPFRVTHVTNSNAFFQAIRNRGYDYVILFDSSGMYRGEDVVNLAALLNHRRLDAVWGSRRLSITDVHQSYKLRYRHNIGIGAISYLGSHLLSFLYLLLYGRYISDTLSGARAIRASFLQSGIDLQDPCMNQKILSRVLRNRGEIFETPVQFFALSPDKVRRTTVLEGIRSMFTILISRFAR